MASTDSPSATLSSCSDCSSSSKSSHCYQLIDHSPKPLADGSSGNLEAKRTTDGHVVCTVTSLKQSTNQVPLFMTDTIDDDMAASAMSLEITQSASTWGPALHSRIASFSSSTLALPVKNSHVERPTMAAIAESEHALDDGSQQNSDLETSILFKTKAQPRCFRQL